MPNDFDNSFLSDPDATPAHEDALVFEVSGQKIGWRASGLALKRASDQGLEVGELLADLQTLFSADIDEEDLEEMDEGEIEEEVQMEGGVAQLLDVAAKLVFVGALHFNAAVRQDVILSILDTSNVGDLPLDRMLQRIFPALEEEGEAGKGKEAASES